jgi:hypothetical protein
MKKIIALVLALGLAVPVHAWHLFSVREKIITVKETNYAACAITGVVIGVVTLGVGLLAGKFLLVDIKGMQDKYLETINKSLVSSCLKFTAEPQGDKTALHMVAFDEHDPPDTADTVNVSQEDLIMLSRNVMRKQRMK